MTFDEVLARFPGARRSGDGYMARCPAHDDGKASLHISRRADGACLLHCHAGCSTATIVSSVDLKMRDLFAEPARRNASARAAGVRKRRPNVVKSNAHPRLGKPVQVYDYNDLNGLCRYQVCRFTLRDGRKTFRQRQPVRGGYVWSLDDGTGTDTQIPLLPYRFDDVARAMHDGRPATTCVVEGEKDADRLWSLNVAATTNVGGAGKWRDEDAGQLVAVGVKRVRILPDDDEPGRRHAAIVARSCHAVGLEVRLVALPRPPSKKGADVSDWLDAGHSVDELHDALERATAWTPDASDHALGSATESIDRLFERCGFGKSAPKDATTREISLRALQRALVGADTIRRANAGEELIERLKSAGVKRAAQLANAVISQVDATPVDTPALPFTDDTPWPEPVDGATLLDEIVARLNEHLVLPPGGASAIALWILHTYLMDTWQLSPLLTFTSPTRRCGKSTTLMLVTSLCPRQLVASNLTAAVLFRIVDRHRPTLAIDEADTLLRDNDDLRALINAGYLKRTARVPRCVGDEHEPVLFSSWSPKVLALIGSPPDTIADRSLLVSLKRKAPHDPVVRLRVDQLEVRALRLRQQATQWAHDHADALVDADPIVPDSLHDRAADNWRPLLALADAVGGHWPQTARTTARSLSGGVDADDRETVSVLLLSDIRDWFDDQDDSPDIAESAVLVTHLKSLETRPWLEWKGDKPLSASGLARLLRGYDIKPTTVRQGEKTCKAYRRGDFLDAWTRYLSVSTRNSRNTATNTGGNGTPQAVTSTRVVTDAEGKNGKKSGPCYGVTSQTPEPDDEVRL